MGFDEDINNKGHREKKVDHNAWANAMATVYWTVGTPDSSLPISISFMAAVAALNFMPSDLKNGFLGDSMSCE